MRASWLRDLVIDVLYARAHVLILGGWETRAAWRYLRWAKAHQRPIPLRLQGMTRGHYKGR